MRAPATKGLLNVAAWFGLVALASSAACGTNLGTCQEDAAKELVYSSQGLVATKGQALLFNSCGQGAFCHSASAKSDARSGAPAGLDFDMLPSPTGWPSVFENRSGIWSSVHGGDMPPAGIGGQKRSNIEWSFDPELHADAPRLPLLQTNEGKAVLRNWLACAAPVVAQTRVPAWARPKSEDLDGGSAEPADFQEIYRTIVQPSCALSGCHDASASGGLAMTDECSAYEHLLEPGACGMKRMTPGDGSSLLLSKLATRAPACGGGMPPVGPLPSSSIALVREWIDAGAPAKSCK